ncbi:nicotinamide riboside transporter PnuC [Brochothrix thermosphacta]|uniref:nicotinamide riboside transporter PnuC n=1 Tax=Brochothrix thermosphacta TaxID=2756 RepID=UPI0009C1962D|nr:nicotinamide riboside transporter PnuC [Brochothrix thermosphacta]
MMTTVRKELLGGWTTFEKSYIGGLLLLQLIVFYFNPENLISMIAGISGVLCVTFVAKGKISNYFFGVIQVSLYLIISLQFVLYGEVLLNSFYFIMQIVGIIVWRKKMNVAVSETSANTTETAVVEARSLSKKQTIFTVTVVVIFWYLFGLMLDYFGSNQPYLDSITTAISVVAQILMTLRYKEQWLLWIVVNILSIILWIIAGNPSMVAMWVAFLFNSSYGYYNWRKLAKQTA